MEGPLRAKFDVLLYDLTSTYFESDPPFPEGDKRQFGYARDKRPDCVQVVIALVVTPEGFPLAYEVLAGNTSDKTTLKDFLKRIEDQYGKAQRIWVMDRGISTEEVLQEMRGSDPPVDYLVGTPKARLKKFEADLLGQPWKNVREGVDVKLQSQEGELYVFAQSRDRVAKERSMRVRQLRGLLHRLKALQIMRLSSKNLLLKLGEARARYRAAWRLFAFDLPEAKSQDKAASFGFRLNRKNSGKPAAVKVVTCCAPISAIAIPSHSGASTSSWSKLKPSSKTLRTLFLYVPSSISAKIASKLTSFSRFWLTVGR